MHAIYQSHTGADLDFAHEIEKENEGTAILHYHKGLSNCPLPLGILTFRCMLRVYTLHRSLSPTS